MAILDATPEEQAFQFIVINNKSAKVKTDNVKAIIADFNEDELQERLKKARVNYKDIPATLLDIDKSEESPFKDLMDWPLNQTENKEIKLTTIEGCLRYTRNQIPGLKEEDDEDSTKYIFMAIWRSVKENFPDLWRSNEKFMSKVNINALNEYIIDRLENIYVMSDFDIFDEAKVEEYTKKILDPINKDYWESDWVIKIQDNAVVRNTIKKDLKIMSHNNASGRKEWYENLESISPDFGVNE